MDNRRLIIGVLTGLVLFLLGVGIASSGSVVGMSIGVPVAGAGALVAMRTVVLWTGDGWTAAAFASIVVWAGAIAILGVLPSWWVAGVRPSGWVKSLVLLVYYLLFAVVVYLFVKRPKPKPTGPKGVSAYGRPLVEGGA